MPDARRTDARRTPGGKVRTPGWITLLALASPLPAQTFVVDAANGPGTNFTSLPAAVAQVPDGAVLLVRPGDYAGFSIQSKGLTVLGEPGTSITGTIQVSHNGAHQPVTLRGFSMIDPPGPTSFFILVAACVAPVLIEQVVLPANVACQPWPYPGNECYFFQGVGGTSSDQIVLRDCVVPCTVYLTSCTAVIDSCDIRGNGPILQPPSQAARPALDLRDCDTTICGSSTIRGGDSVSLFGLPAGHGIALLGGSLRVLDGTVTAGTVHGAPAQSTSTIHATGPVPPTRISPRVVLQGSNGPLAGTDVMPALDTSGAPTGGTLQATARTELGDLVVLAVGLPSAPLSVPGITDPFWLDPNVHVYVAIGVQQAAAPIAGTVAVPAGPGFLGLVLGWQAACQGPVTGFQATNPGLTLVR